MVDIKRDSHGRFLPGYPTNPRGRPTVKDSLLDCIRAELEAISPDTGLTNSQMIAQALMTRAKRGDTKAADLILSYLHARPTASMDITSGGEPVRTFQFVLPSGEARSAQEMANRPT